MRGTETGRKELLACRRLVPGPMDSGGTHDTPPRTPRLQNCLNWRRSGGRRRSGSEEETPPPPIDPAPHGTNKRQKVKGLLIGGRERSCRGLGHARAGGRGEGGERFPRRMNAAQPGPRHCPDPGCSATPFPASSIPFPPLASEAL